MHQPIESLLGEFLREHQFVNPILIKESENMLGALYFAREENGKITTIKIINKGNLEELYQLNSLGLINFLTLHTSYVNDLTKKIASPKLISINNTFVQEYKDLVFYMMHFIPGENKEPFYLNLEQKIQIAHVLATLHQTQPFNYDRNFFNLKSYFFASCWKNLVTSHGLALVEKLAIRYLNNPLKNLLRGVYTRVTYDEILRIGQAPTLVISHSDIKPKNVIWNEAGQHFLVDWENFCLMRAEIDFIDTVTSWVLQKNTNQYYLDMAAAKCFRDAYALPLAINDVDIYISAAKWIFWVMTCYSLANEAMLREGLTMLALLENNHQALLQLS
ncbi:phosphotransferase [Legionella saoudiensis]|uniref:phosphotransferase n=1 Tax=Legionella saoudiensis TaxID=1750561 RepID=UPI000730AA4C|nr:phosphotransferase [Legionella saoudiensis]